MSDWHILCVTNKGVVSILKNLDLRTARETYKRLRPEQHPTEYIYPDCEKCKHQRGWNGGSYIISGSSDRLDRVEAIGPEGEKLNPWDGVEPRIIDMRGGCNCPKPLPHAPLIEPLALTALEARALREAGSLS